MSRKLNPEEMRCAAVALHPGRIPGWVPDSTYWLGVGEGAAYLMLAADFIEKAQAKAQALENKHKNIAIGFCKAEARYIALLRKHGISLEEITCSP